MPRRSTTLLLLVPLVLAGCERSKTPDLLTIPAKPPAPTSSVAAARPVETPLPPKPVPTPASTALAIAEDDAAEKDREATPGRKATPRATTSASTAGRGEASRDATTRTTATTTTLRAPASTRGGAAATASRTEARGPCAGLGGQTLEDCIDREARRDATAADDDDDVAAFRAAQARRDRELIEREAEERAALAAQRDADEARVRTRDWDRDGDVDWRDRRLAADRPPYDDPPDAIYAGPVDDGPRYDPPPEDEDAIYDDDEDVVYEEDVIYEEPPYRE